MAPGRHSTAGAVFAMWSDAKSIHIEVRFYKVAVHDDKLMFISLVACSQDIKAIRAALAAGLTFQCG
jgi:hypothetical protein